MSAILDNITGGGLLPYIYCKKTTIEDSSIEGKLDITLHLELYQDKKRLLDSAWLNSLDDNNSNFLDAMFIQVLEYKTFANVRRILPSAVRHGVFNFSSPGRGSLYGGKIVYGDNYLPRGELGSGYTGGFIDALYGMEMTEKSGGVGENTQKIFSSESDSIKPPIQVANSSIIGSLSTKNSLLNYEAEGKLREEIVEGRPYYIIPFEYKTTYDPEQNENLGFAFYTFLHVPYWANSLDIGVNITDEDAFFEKFIVEALRLALFVMGVSPSFRKAPGACADFLPTQTHDFPLGRWNLMANAALSQGKRSTWRPLLPLTRRSSYLASNPRASPCPNRTNLEQYPA